MKNGSEFRIVRAQGHVEEENTMYLDYVHIILKYKINWAN